jgi:XTP/dITP diphosphohydrolase
MREVLIATSNQGKLRDFAAAAAPLGIFVAPVPAFSSLAAAREDAPTFEANACKKAEHYSRGVKGRYVLADDSGLEVDALQGAPGVRSARYAADGTMSGASAPPESPMPGPDSVDAANNGRLLAELRDIPEEHRGARFVCVLAVAREGRLIACFRGEVAGRILHEPRGTCGFGYDPLFFLPEADRSFAELSPEEKAGVSHRGKAFRKFLKWYSNLEEHSRT